MQVNSLVVTSNKGKKHVLRVTLQMDGDAPRQEVALRTAEAFLQFVPEAVRFDELQVVMVKGVGVGLLTVSSSQTESRSPAE